MPAQCDEGFRILRNMKKLSVNENHFESLNLGIYEYCKRLIDLIPKDIVFLTCKQWSNSQRYPFCKDTRMHWKKKHETTKLEEEIKTLNKETLDVEASGGKEKKRQNKKN